MAEGSKEVRGKGISGMTLKWIAIITMIIDHIGAVIIEKYLVSIGSYVIFPSSVDDLISMFGDETGRIVLFDLLLRSIGRAAFPIYCFLLVEGFFHTRSVLKYARNLAMFALISEIPFNLATSGELWNPGYQSVFVTLLLGLIMMAGLKYVREGVRLQGLPGWAKVLLSIAVIGAACLVATLLKTDYSYLGILAIAAVYYLHDHTEVAGLVGIVVLSVFNSFEILSLWTALLMYKYNGERGRGPKYLFYALYPAHLLVLAMIAKYFI